MSSFEDIDMSEGKKNCIPHGDFSIVKKPAQRVTKHAVFEMTERKMIEDDSREEYPHDLLSTSIDNPKGDLEQRAQDKVILSRIDHAVQSLHNISENSEDLDLELLMHLNGAPDGNGHLILQHQRENSSVPEPENCSKISMLKSVGNGGGAHTKNQSRGGIVVSNNVFSYGQSSFKSSRVVN